MRKFTKCIMSTALILAMSTSAQASDLVVGMPNWASGKAMAHVLKTVLEDNTGLDVELQSGTNPIIFEAMDKGTMQVHPEVWMPNNANLDKMYRQDKGSVTRNPNWVVSLKRMCVNAEAGKKYDITSISDLTDQKKTKVLDTDGDGKGEIWIGTTGWASTNVEQMRAKTYGYDQTVELLQLDEAAAMVRLDAAVTQGTAYAGICLTPHYMFKKYDLTVLKEAKHDPAKWTVVQPTNEPDWLKKSSVSTEWPDVKLHIYYAKSLIESHPQAARILNNVKLTTDQVTEMVFAITIEKQDPVAYAKKWVKENADLVDSWL